ncbi:MULTISPECIES: hypothetical protein [unclassified Streptomyces]|uniref:hypothetical protein n=1 Tax=unclassified Streptomyces TaxID=2593676 RepID=UPI0022573B85|nr:MULTISPECIES: hypothetical protein [unclassified Streptomyces]MCX5141107.1 hypothetical protein [Streptomyces sp. NBC_00338]WRZ65598.1 hypothetical protein OG408_17690 [Streptomyces sp. NBC_01257]WSU59592.1 hypothetical protein OG450_17865 [Streptomyces sp. NBC_01104]
MYKLARTGALVATGLLTALALTGCGSDGDKDGADKSSGPTATPAPGGSADSGSGSGGGDSGSTGDLKALEGAWAGQTGGKAVVLSVASGKAVVVAESHVCSGTAKDMGGKPMLALTCADGDKDRTMGAIESNDGKTVVVSWDGGTKDTLAKTDADSLEGLPDLPTP